MLLDPPDADEFFRLHRTLMFYAQTCPSCRESLARLGWVTPATAARPGD
jgi:hypothetical protein